MWLWLDSPVAFVSFVAMESQLRKPRGPTSQAGGRKKKHSVHIMVCLYNADLKTRLLKRPSINFLMCCAAPWDTKRVKCTRKQFSAISNHQFVITYREAVLNVRGLMIQSGHDFNLIYTKFSLIYFKNIWIHYNF